MAAVLTVHGGAARAFTPDEPIREMSDKAEATRDRDADPHHRSLLVVPIPQVNPTLGTGATLVGALFWNPKREPEPWISGVGAMYTSNGSWAVGALHRMSLGHDRHRFTAFGGYADVNIDFFGIGPDAGARNLSVELNEQGYAGLLDGQTRLAPHFYAGARLLFLDLDTSIKRDEPLFPDLEIPSAQFDSRLVMAGPSLAYDSRDNSLNTRQGTYVTGTWLFGIDALRSDFTHDKLNIGANFYQPLGDDTVVAARGALCRVSDGAPFYDLCLYGASSDLRGYEAGRFRDRASWAVQAELRQHLFGRFGAVAFAGIGGIAPSLSRIDETEMLPAAGVGLRWMPSRSAGVNLRLDVAFGEDSEAIYVSLGEAF